jgi:DNA-binding NarL/FixJ family response regulator
MIGAGERIVPGARDRALRGMGERETTARSGEWPRSTPARVELTVAVYDEAGCSSEAWLPELVNSGILALLARKTEELPKLLAEHIIEIVIVCCDDSLQIKASPTSLLPRSWQGRRVFVVERLSADDVLGLRPHADLILPAPVESATLLRAIELFRERDDDVTRFAVERKLSPREAELLRLALSGLNNDEAASALGCCRATVASFWNRIFRKVGVSGQRDVMIELLRSASERGTFRIRRSDPRR